MRSELQDWYASDRDQVTPQPERWKPVDWTALALRYCRDGTDGLARHFRPVPSEHLTPTGVHCLCGTETPLRDREYVQCAGDCGRWFLTDNGSVWAAQLPRQEP